MKYKNITQEILNRVFFAVYKTVGQLPFSGQYWLEQFMLETVHPFLDAQRNELQFTSKKPVDICRTFLDFLIQQDHYREDYRLEESGDNLLLHIQRDKCLYWSSCLRAQAGGLPFFCIRLAVLQATLRTVLGENYSTSVETGEEGVCHGRLFPATQPREEIVTREGHLLKIAGRRAILLTQEIYASLLMSVREHAPHALKHVLYDAGYQSGLTVARKTRALYSDTGECLQLLLQTIKNGGLSNVELVSFDLSRSRARIRCYDSFQVAAVEEYGHLYRTPQVICDLLRGIFAAFFSVLLEKEMLCEEMICQSVEGNYCEFLALPLPQQTAREEGASWPK